MDILSSHLNADGCPVDEELEIQNIEQVSASNIKINENVSIMQQSMSGDCLGRNELGYQDVDTGRVHCEAFHKLQPEPLQDIPQNVPPTDSNSSYYDEIINFITTKTVPDNSSLSYKMLLKKRARNYSVSNGILFYRMKKVLRTQSEQWQILKDSHVEEKTGVHLGVKKMSQIINGLCFWRGQYVDIANFVRQCTKCRENCNLSSPRRNSEHETDVEETTISGVCEIWQKVEVNLFGPYSKNDGQLVFIATIVDPASHYVVAKLVAANDCAAHLSNFILDTFCTFGVVKCYLNDTCKEYLNYVKCALKQHDELVKKWKISPNFSLQDFLFILSQDEEECLWIRTCFEPYINNFMPLCETDLCVYVFELNTKISTSSPFLRMFNRNPYVSLQDDKENDDINIVQSRNEGYRISHRRLLRSSILQCRHCKEAFTSKISFRIHQRKHTEEAHRRGMLEGQIKYLGLRERRVLQKSVSKHKHIAVKRQSNSQNNDSIFCEGRCQSSLCTDVPEHKRAELRASTVEAVKQLVARKKDNKRKRRGKYRKFPSEIQEQMARYAIDHGTLLTVRHFSEKLGVIVCESTVRNIMKWYQCFTPEIKDEIGRFAAAFGVEAAASHFSKRLGRDVRFGLIRKFKKMYLSQYSEVKSVNSEKKTNKTKLTSSTRGVNSHSDASLYSSEMKEKIGCYANDHSIPSTIEHFSQQFNMILNENLVQKFKKLYQAKQKSNHLQQSQMPQPEFHQKQQLNLEQPLQELPVLQQSLEQQRILFHQKQHSEHLHRQHDQLQQPHLQLVQQPQQLQQQQQQHQHQHQHQQQQQLQHQQHHLQQQHQEQQPRLLQHQIPQQQTELQQHESLPCDSNDVALLSFQHQANSSLQETTLQSSNQTIDILQTSLNLLNNPQLNNSTAIIYNTPFQIPSTPQVSSNQLVPVNSQQSTPVTFQTTNHCSESNISTSGPLSYQPQDVPISASVIINQNVATVQSFSNPQMFPAFAQTHTVQPSAIVSDNNLPLHPTGPQISTLPHHPSPMPSQSALPTITVAVAPLSGDPHFQTTNGQPAVVLSQAVPQSIFVSHSQTGTLLQHIIDSQTHIQAAPAQIPQHLMSGVHTDSSPPYPEVIDQTHTITSETFTRDLQGNMPPSYGTSTSFGIENRNTTFNSTESSQSTKRLEIKRSNNYTEQMEGLEIQTSQDRVTEESERDTRVILLNSQGLHSSCEAVPDHINSKSSSSANPDNVDYSNNKIFQEKIEKLSKRSCSPVGKGSSKTSVNKNSRKKEKKKVSKGKGKVCEQKRGSYTIYSPEARAEMGKYAADHGCQKACEYFQNKHGYNVADSTMRSLRNKYLKKRELCAEENNGEVTSLGYAPRGRPMYLGQYDEIVQECMKELVKSGEKITSFLAIATAKHVLTQFEPHLLEENGGKIKLNSTWAKSFLKRSGYKNYS